MDGVNCKTNSNPGGSPPDTSFCFAVDDSLAYRNNNPVLDVSVRYYDSGSGSLDFQYDANSDPYKSGGLHFAGGKQCVEDAVVPPDRRLLRRPAERRADFRVVGPAGATYYLDRVQVVGQQPAPVGPVTNFTATPGSGQITLDWTNPPDLFYVGTMIRYKTGGYPTSTTDGALLLDRASAPGSADSYVQSGFDNIRYYYTASLMTRHPTTCRLTRRPPRLAALR